MLLSLEKVPPLMSHVFCVFTGILLSYYLGSDRNGNECYLPGKVMVAFPNKYFGEESIPVMGSRVHFAKTQAAKAACVLKNASAVVVQNDPFVVAAVPLKNAGALQNLFTLKNKERLSIVPDSRLDGLQSCSDTQIKYGYVH